MVEGRSKSKLRETDLGPVQKQATCPRVEIFYVDTAAVLASNTTLLIGGGSAYKRPHRHSQIRTSVLTPAYDGV